MSRHQTWLQWSLWTSIATVALILFALAVMWLIEQPPPALFDRKFVPFTLMLFFVCLVVIAIVGPVLHRKRWAQQWLFAASLAYLPVLALTTIWIDWPDDTSRLSLLLAIVVAGGLWALTDHIRHRGTPKP